MTPDQAKALRRSLAPQIEAYDRLSREMRWLPYLMFSQPQGFRSDVVNTDRHGFRWTRGPGGGIASVESPPAGPCGVLVGGSTAFGVGAGSDAATVASRLSERTGLPFVNLGVRAHCSTQELLTFLLYSDALPPVRHIVVMTGVNDLLIQYGANWFDDQLGGVLYSDRYFDAMSRSGGSWLGRLRRRLAGGAGASPAPKSFDALLDERESVRRARMQGLLRRNLAHWGAIAAGLDARMLFTLQPTFPWMGRTAVHQEQQLFEAREAQDPRRETLVGRVLDPANRDWYAETARDACAAHGIAFADLNESLRSFVSDDEWLFVDRAHFTDRGYAALAQCLESLLEVRCPGGS